LSRSEADALFDALFVQGVYFEQALCHLWVDFDADFSVFQKGLFFQML